MTPTCPKCGGVATTAAPLVRESQGDDRTSFGCPCGHVWTIRETDAEFACRVVAVREATDARTE